MKKILLLIGLIATLSSCGGGGGGSQTSQATPTPNPNKPTENPSQIPGNIGDKSNFNPSQNIGNSESNNNSNSGQSTGNSTTNNSSNSGQQSQAPIPNNFEKPTNQGIMTGKGVQVAVLDEDFITDNETMKYYKVGQTFEKVKKDEFKGRLDSNYPVATGHRPSKNDHGLRVATILGGESGNGAKGATIHGVSLGTQSTGLIINVDRYKELQAKGVRIYNQSLGIPQEFSPATYRNDLWESIKTVGIWTQDKMDQKVDELINFYKKAVNEGSLFVWAAGNYKKNGTELTAVSVQSGLPIAIPSLQKGWIAVVGLEEQADGSAKDFPKHFAWAGESAAYWTISANGRCELPGCSSPGSSNAAPRVTATAAKVKERFPWMTGHEIQQTILTTATKINTLLIGNGDVSSRYGWGYLNEEKALKGPAQFDNILLVGKKASDNGLKGQFNANIGNSMTSIFENDIKGDGGLKKSGNGTLILTGNNSYAGNTTIDEGKLEIYGNNTSDITINSQGTLVTYPTAIINKKDGEPKSIYNNGGTFENRGSGAIITGNYIATAGSITKAEIGSKLIVNGTVNLNGESATLQTLSNGRYITAKPLSTAVIEAGKGIKGNFANVETTELVNGSTEVKGNLLNVNLSRKNVLDYVKEFKETDIMQENTAQNIETAFQKLDEIIENGTAENIAQFERKAATLQALTSLNRAAVLDSLSGQIYASAQALTFQHSQTVNKDLSNRLVMLGTLDNVGDKFGLWVSGFGANGKLKQDGYGTGDTKVFGGQVGVDKQFGENLILGTALSYSKADVKFDRYGGKSNANNFGVSLYGRLGNKNKPLYLQGRLGAGFVDSDVERDIILSSNDYSRAKINHNDKIYSGYLETGYDIKNKNEDFVLTPFAGLTHDTLQRGSFSEKESQFGLTATRKNYSQTAALVGLRVGKSVNWSSGSKTTFQGYVTHQKAFKDEDLSFDARYTGLPGAKFKVKGIGLSKNKTWIGAGALTEVNKNFGWYVNYDGSVDSKKGKGNSNVYTTGVRINF